MLAGLLGDRIRSLRRPTRTLTPSAVAKQAANVDLTRRLMGLADWTDRSQAAAEEIITELGSVLV